MRFKHLWIFQTHLGIVDFYRKMEEKTMYTISSAAKFGRASHTMTMMSHDGAHELVLMTVEEVTRHGARGYRFDKVSIHSSVTEISMDMHKALQLCVGRAFYGLHASLGQVKIVEDESISGDRVYLLNSEYVDKLSRTSEDDSYRSRYSSYFGLVTPSLSDMRNHGIISNLSF